MAGVEAAGRGPSSGSFMASMRWPAGPGWVRFPTYTPALVAAGFTEGPIGTRLGSLFPGSPPQEGDAEIVYLAGTAHDL